MHCLCPGSWWGWPFVLICLCVGLSRARVCYCAMFFIWEAGGRTWRSRWLLSKPVLNTVRAWWYLSPSINRLRIVGAAFYSTYAGPRMTLHALFGTLSSWCSWETWACATRRDAKMQLVPHWQRAAPRKNGRPGPRQVAWRCLLPGVGEGGWWAGVVVQLFLTCRRPSPRPWCGWW